MAVLRTHPCPWCKNQEHEIVQARNGDTFVYHCPIQDDYYVEELRT
jgi:hypothetical protein